jgi:thymidylate synthase
MIDKIYTDLLHKIRDTGEVLKGRNGNTVSIVNANLTLPFTNELLAVTVKKTFYKKAIAEFIWILSGEKNIEYLQKNGVLWWNGWANDKNELTLSYGEQLRSYNGVFDQIPYVISQIKKGSRRAHITLWNPCDLDKQELPCCYTGFDFVVRKDNKLEMVMNFRSSDVFLGLPMDIIVGQMLLLYVAHESSLKATKLHLNLSNAHIYEEHIPLINKVLIAKSYKPAIINNIGNFTDINSYDIVGYKSSDYIKAPLIH